MEDKRLAFQEVEVKSEGTHLYLEGYAAVYGNVDSYKDIIQAGAFDAFLASADAKRVKFCYNHDPHDVIGVIESLYSDENGLKFKAKLSNTTRGKDVAELINDGALSEFSIGYRVEDAIYKEEGVRVLTKLYLYEFSVVSRAANPEAVLTATERKEEQIEEASAPEEKSYAQLAQELEELEGRKAEIIAQMDAMIIEAINI